MVQHYNACPGGVRTFFVPIALADPEVRPGLEIAAKGSRASGTPFVPPNNSEELLVATT